MEHCTYIFFFRFLSAVSLKNEEYVFFTLLANMFLIVWWKLGVIRNLFFNPPFNPQLNASLLDIWPYNYYFKAIAPAAPQICHCDIQPSSIVRVLDRRLLTIKWKKWNFLQHKFVVTIEPVCTQTDRFRCLYWCIFLCP